MSVKPLKTETKVFRNVVLLSGIFSSVIDYIVYYTSRLESMLKRRNLFLKVFVLSAVMTRRKYVVVFVSKYLFEKNVITDA